MSAQVFQFDLGDLIVTWGSFIIEGAGDGNYVEIKYDNPLATEHEGGLGDVTILLNKSKKGSAKIVLGQASKSNNAFAAAVTTQRNGGGLVSLPLTVAHVKGTSRAFARTAYVREAAEMNFGDNHNNREWMLGCADLDLFIGGNLR